jgi:hypothetical protein
MKLNRIVLCGFMFVCLVLSGFLFAGNRSSVRGDLITMTATITASYLFDVDTGQMVDLAEKDRADLWYHNVDDLEMYLHTQNGAEFANLGIVDFDSVTDCSLYTLSSEPMNASISNNTIPVGTVLVVRTNIGNYAKIRIDYYPFPINITIVYQNTPGSPIVPEFPLLTVPLFTVTTLLAIIAYRRKRTR